MLNDNKINITAIRPEDNFIFRERHDYGPYPASYYYIDWVNDRCIKYYGSKLSLWGQLSLGAYHGGKSRAIIGSTKEWDILGKNILNKIIKNKNFVSETNAQAKKIASRYSNLSKKLIIKSGCFSSLTELIKFHKKWIWFYGEYSFWNCLLWLAVSDKLSVYVANLLKLNYKINKNDIQTLTTPTAPSYVYKEEIELLKIAKTINFQKKNFKTQPSKAKNILKRHASKWAFISWDYIGPDYLTPEICLKKIFKLAKNNKEINILLKEKINYHSKIKKQQKALIKKYKIKLEHVRMLEDLNIVTIMQDDKKQVCTLAQFALQKSIFTYIGKKLKIQPRDCIKFSEQELWQALKGDYKIIKNSLPERLRATATISDSKAIHLIYGRQAVLLYKKFDIKISQVNEFKGQVACRGVAKGKAKILASTEELSKIKKGDILITGMTTPDYVPAMKLAAAIITDEGGLTCHATIVSRELGIPCIIGTKIATKVLRDGDLVEVDANRGIVKIIK